MDLTCSFRNVHNNLRITRILKSLGELGFEHYQAPLVHFFLEETLIKKNLSSVKRSVLDYFLFAVRNKHKRRELIGYAFQHFEPKDKFVWCPRRIQKRFKKKAEAKRQDSPSRTKRDGEKRDEEESILCEGSSVDPEPRDEGSSVDPLPLNNGNHVDNGEMDLSGSETSTIKSDEEENQMKPSESKSEQDTIQVKDIEEPKNNSSSQKGTSLEKQDSESPKHSLKSSPLSERAGKLARTKDNTASISDHKKPSGDMFSISSLEKPDNLDANDGEKSNGMDSCEPMDTRPSAADP